MSEVTWSLGVANQTGQEFKDSSSINVNLIFQLYIYLEVFLFVVITIGNGLVIASFIKFPRLRTKLPHHLLVHLAAADLLLGLCMPFHVFTFADPKDFERYVGTPYMCLTKYASATICMGASLSILVFLSVHVFLSIKYPYKYNAWITPGKVHRIALVIWACVVIYGLIPYTGVHTYTVIGGPGNYTAACDLVKVWESWYLYTLLLLMILLTIALCSIYFIIFRVATQKSRRGSVASFSLYNNKAAKTFLTVTISTIICFVPFAVCVMMESLHWHSANSRNNDLILELVSAIATLVLLFHSCLNPIIYSLRLPAFQDAFKSLLTCGYLAKRVRPERFATSFRIRNPNIRRSTDTTELEESSFSHVF